ncbi:MAG TPA: hypothetical protein VJR04_04645 [Terriglobales bacterium]|nr:hypothetical protein [Terriglobales bacterium]
MRAGFDNIYSILNAMCGIAKFAVAFVMVGATCCLAATPDDIDFRARLISATPTYHMGEALEVEVSYASQSEKKFHGSFCGLRPQFTAVRPQITPTDGVLDLRALRRGRVFAGNNLCAVGYLGILPNRQQLDLSEWYRFQKPGHYSVTFTSTEVSRVKSAGEGGGFGQLTLESNPVDFDILPADPAWVATEISDIEQELNAATNDGQRGVAVHRLALLDTPTSVQALVRLYLASGETGESWIYDSALHDSSQIDVIIPLLRAALSDPTIETPADLPQWLADLQTRRQLGIIPPYPNDDAGQQKAKEEWKARSGVRENYFSQDNALLAASIGQRSGSRKAAATYQVWLDSTQINATTPQSRETLMRLQSDVLAMVNDLDRDRQVQFLVSAWKTMPHEQLLPLVRQLALESLNHPPGYGTHDAIRLWCEDLPADCSAAIIRNITETNAKMDRNIVLMMPESEHSELDTMLEAQLKGPLTYSNWNQLQSAAAIALRAGSRSLVPAVEALLDQSAGILGCGENIQGDLIGYLFRVAPKDAEKRLAAALESTNKSCGVQMLRTLHSDRPSDDIIPIATKALNSPNLVTATWTALYLEDHGDASAKDALWRRLEALWAAWSGKPSQSTDQALGSATGPDAEAANLEQALASALAHGTNWELTTGEISRLHDGCHTQMCRDIADGKGSVNF